MTGKVYYNCGGGVRIGQSSSIIKFGDYTVCVDWGDSGSGEGRSPEINIDKIHCLIVSHGHRDHAGRVPDYLKLHSQSRILMTEATLRLSRVLWRQCLRNNEPPFTASDIDNVIKVVEHIEPGQIIDLNDDLKLLIFDSGHILGSISCCFFYKGEAFIVTSDICLTDRGLIKGAKIPDIREKVRLLVIESTYIDREHPDINKQIGELISSVQEVYNRGGKVLIPAFSIDRAQQILMILKDKFDVYIDGARTVTEIYNRFFSGVVMETAHSFRRSYFNSDGTVNREGVRDRMSFYRSERPAVIVATSGMMDPGTISEFWAKTLLPNDVNGIFFVSYCDPKTLAGQISGGAKAVSIGDSTVFVGCKVSSLNFSGHVDRKGIISIEDRLKPSHIIYNHGSLGKMTDFISERSHDGIRRAIARVNYWQEV